MKKFNFPRFTTGGLVKTPDQDDKVKMNLSPGAMYIKQSLIDKVGLDKIKPLAQGLEIIVIDDAEYDELFGTKKSVKSPYRLC